MIPNQHGVPIIGSPQQIQIMVSQLCVECFPEKAIPGIFIMGGDSLCGECAGKRKKEKDDKAVV